MFSEPKQSAGIHFLSHLCMQNKILSQTSSMAKQDRGYLQPAAFLLGLTEQWHVLLSDYNCKDRRQLNKTWIFLIYQPVFSILNRTWETVKRVGRQKSVSADGKTVVTFVSLLASFLVTVLINSQCILRASM